MRSIEEVLNSLPIENKAQKFLRFCKNIKSVVIVLYDLRKENKKDTRKEKF